MNNIKHITGEVRAIADNVEETRKIQFVISTEKKDRHGTVIPIANWQLDNFNKNGIVGYQHDVYGGWFDNDPDKVIGKGRAFIEGDQLIGEVEFEPAEINPMAEKIFRKILFGSLTSTSVGFIEKTKGAMVKDNPADANGPETYHYGQVELLEFSIVNLPSNTDATKREIESKLEAKINELVEKRLERKQSATAPANVLAKLRLQELELKTKS